MKKNVIALLALLLIGFSMQAQTTAPASAIINKHYWKITPRLAYDIPHVNNNMPYIKYKGGINAGITIDRYWNWLGLGADADFFTNKSVNKFPLTGLTNAAAVSLNSFSKTETSLNRFFYGIGPSVRFITKPKLSVELIARAGVSSIKGGEVQLNETTTIANDLLNYYAGFNSKVVFAAKGLFRFNYSINNKTSLAFGSYFINHFKSKEQFNTALGFTGLYREVNNTGASPKLTANSFMRSVPCNCDVSSYGFFAGVSFKFQTKKQIKKCEPDYSLVVTAKDKITGELIPYTEVTVKSATGNIVLTGTTNSFGVAVFENVKPFDYAIDGVIGKTAFEGNNAVTQEFVKQKTVQKTILYGSRNFIITGKIFECNSSKPLPNVTVVVGKIDLSYVDIVLSKNDGSYMLQIPEAEGDYSLYGKKDKYLSQVEVVNPANYNRNRNLFIKLEICAERADCGKTLLLKNILFDLDKYDIKSAAAKELDKLIQFMKDNPSVHVELSSHTDSRNTAGYNQTLSQNRANASVDYIVMKGIERGRLTSKGYGESKLLNNCADGVNCTEAEHAINRRTEIKIICVTQ